MINNTFSVASKLDNYIFFKAWIIFLSGGKKALSSGNSQQYTVNTATCILYLQQFIKLHLQPGSSVQAFNTSIREAGAGGSL